MKKNRNTSNIIIIETFNSDNSSEEKYNEFLGHIEKCKEILEDCILETPENTPFTIQAHLGWPGNKNFEETSTTLGWASTSEKIIAINPFNTNTYQINDKDNPETNIHKLNDKDSHPNILVILHEIIHVFGLFPNQVGEEYNISTINDSTSNNEATRRIYIGEKGLLGYKKILLANNLKIPDPLYIILEDDFDEGTKHVHLEEAYNNKNDKYEVIKINNQYYPTLWNEIMTGLMDKDNNYITPITMGCLEDLGFKINYNSTHIVTIGLNMKFVNINKSKHYGTKKNYLSFNEENYNINYLNKFLNTNNLENTNTLVNMIKKNWGNKIT
tara:strand:+ start:5491 stop:6474 length:984 start_codon:yes stop_codon:yes gene_type:complete